MVFLKIALKVQKEFLFMKKILKETKILKNVCLSKKNKKDTDAF